MAIVLTDVEARVLGALVEKDIATPDYYPLSLNALLNACNQKNNRDPVMNLDENQVREALSGLEAMGLAGPASSADSRVTKYEHHLQDAFNFSRGETAVICVLLLRGPQTLGELRSRTERLHRFEDLEAVQAALQHLMRREPPLAVMLPSGNASFAATLRRSGVSRVRPSGRIEGVRIFHGTSGLPVQPLSVAVDLKLTVAFESGDHFPI